MFQKYTVADYEQVDRELDSHLKGIKMHLRLKCNEVQTLKTVPTMTFFGSILCLVPTKDTISVTNIG